MLDAVLAASLEELHAARARRAESVRAPNGGPARGTAWNRFFFEVRQCAFKFTDGVLDAVLAGSLEELYVARAGRAAVAERSGGVVRASVAARSARTGAPDPAAIDAGFDATLIARTGGRVARVAKTAVSSELTAAPDDVAIDALLDRMLELLKVRPEGVRSEELRAFLRMEKVPFRTLMKEAEEADLVVRRGEKRTTTFLAV
ncbi:hypothetical protein [Pendulispora albinea]|uniref:Uncharacterized protein n=1 Tax=Pendulispora albinea TaxID=2741071 RepID=A0ABZ2M875_9BACT